MKPFTTTTIATTDTFTDDERQDIANNIVEFIECGQIETFEIKFGVMVRTSRPITFTDVGWLMAVHDDVKKQIIHDGTR